MKCPTPNCPNSLPLKAIRKYCKTCRNRFRYYEQLKPVQLLNSTKRHEKSLFSISHFAERKQNGVRGKVLEFRTVHARRARR